MLVSLPNELSSLVVPPSGGNSTRSSGATDNFNETFNASGNDTILSNGKINLSITGSPTLGQVENLIQKYNLFGGGQIQSSDTGGDGEQSSVTSSPPSQGGASGGYSSSDNVSGNETVAGSDTGNATVASTGNSTLSIVDPTTNLTTTDTLVDKSSLAEGDTESDTETDTHPQSAASGGEDDLTNNDQLKEALAGSDKSTETIGVNGTTPDGTTINGTDTTTNTAQLSGTANDGDTGSETVGESNGGVSSETEGDTETAGDDIKVNTKTTDNQQYQSSAIDPTTGLTDTVNLTDANSDQENDEETDSATNTESSSTGNAATGAPAVATSDDKFDNKLIQGGLAIDALKIFLTAQGIDLQGEKVNVQETIQLNGNATDSVSDEDIGEDDSGIPSAPPSGDTETVHTDVLAHAGISDTIIGTITSTDPTTGIATTTTDNDFIDGTDDEHDHEDETDVRSPGNPDNDTASQTDPSTLSISWNDSENVTQANPDGTPAGTPTNTTNSGSDTTNASVALSIGSDGTVTPTVTGTDSGNSTSSDPTVGSTIWSGQPLSQSTIQTYSDDATPLSQISPQAATQGTSGNSVPSGGSNSASADAGLVADGAEEVVTGLNGVLLAQDNAAPKSKAAADTAAAKEKAAKVPEEKKPVQSWDAEKIRQNAKKAMGAAWAKLGGDKKVISTRGNKTVSRDKIVIVLGKPDAGARAHSDARSGTITIDPSLSEMEATDALIFEMHNVAKYQAQKNLEIRAYRGQLSKDEYVRRTAKMEYDNYLAAAPFIRKAAESIDPKYVSAAQAAVDAKDFDEWLENSPEEYIKHYQDWWEDRYGATWRSAHPDE